jgi:phospholipase D1/2
VDDKWRLFIDSRSYYLDLAQEIESARSHVWIQGWDFDSRVVLNRDNDALRHFQIGRGFFGAIKAIEEEESRGIRFRLLVWNPPVLYLPDREIFQDIKIFADEILAKLDIRFVRDNMMPFGSSQHRKIVIIDDRVAFLGGADISSSRWDEPGHRWKSKEKRADLEGIQSEGDYQNHETHLKVAGPAVREISEIFLKSWKKYQSSDEGMRKVILSPSRDVITKPLRREVIDLNPIEAQVIESEATYANKSGHNPKIQMICEMIHQAEREIYIENQYVTSDEVILALKAKLLQNSDVSIVIVTNCSSSSWLEKVTIYERMRSRLRFLKSFDIKKRLKILCPTRDQSPEERGWVKIHSKLMLVDRKKLFMGSSNLNNRSMGLDSELDVLMDLREEDGLKILCGLISDHSEQNVRDSELLGRSLLDFLETEGYGSLGEYRPQERSARIFSWIPLVDPKCPGVLERFLHKVARQINLKSNFEHGVRKALVLFIGVILAVLLFQNFSNIKAEVMTWDDPLQQMSYGTRLLTATGMIAIGSTLFIPLNILIVATAFVFDAWTSIACCLTGALISAGLGYGIGFSFDRYFKVNIRWKKILKLRARLREAGWYGVALVRFFPVAPYALANIAIGTLRLNPKHYFLGTFVGVLPGIVAISFLQKTLLEAMRSPTLFAVGLFTATLSVFVFCAYQVRKKILLHERVKNTFL